MVLLCNDPHNLVPCHHRQNRGNMGSGTIHYYVHGRGRGHGTRTLKITAALEAAGVPVRLFSGADPLEMIRASHSVEAVDSLLPSQPFAWAGLIFRRMRAARGAIREDAPFALISDGDLPSLLAAHLEKIPSIAVGHAEVFGETKRPGTVPRLPWLKEKLVAKISSLSATRHVAVNFVPTVPLNRHTVAARPATAEIIRKQPPAQDVVCYFRDDNGDAILDALAATGLKVTLFSNTASPREHIEVHPLDRAAFLLALADTRRVVASAGSQLLSECVAAGIPIFALYKQDDAEQRLNVAMLQNAGLGEGMSFEAFTPSRLQKFIETSDEDSTASGASRTDNPVDEVVRHLIVSLRDNGHF